MTISPVNSIVMLAPHFPEYSFRLASALSELRPVSLVVDDHRFGTEFQGRAPAIPDGVDLHRIDFQKPSALLRILQLIRSTKPDIIHFQEPAGLKSAIICVIVAWLFAGYVRLALTVHDPVPHEGRDEAIVRRSMFFRKFIRKRADIIFTHGQFCAGIYEGVKDRKDQRVEITDHGVILDDLAPPPRVAERLSVLFCGRMEAYKGVAVLHDAFRQLSAKRCEVDLTVAGAGQELDRIGHLLAQLPNVEVINSYICPMELMKLIAKADCLILPYLSATQSGILAAAFGNSRFVIASNVGGLPDVVADRVNGLLVEPGNAAHLAETIEAVAQDARLRSRLREGAAATAQDQLNWRRIARGMMEAYER